MSNKEYYGTLGGMMSDYGDDCDMGYKREPLPPIGPRTPPPPPKEPLPGKVLESVNIPTPEDNPPVINKSKSTSILGLGELVTNREYKRQDATHTISWTGPLITLEQWREILAFLRWANDTYKTEAQAKMFVNAKLGKWAFWAFPQNITRTLSTTELPNAECEEQLKMFRYSDGWEYLGTIHSHCNSSAFQSSTDHGNEVFIDGLHFTIGYLDREALDLHLRISIGRETLNIKEFQMFFDEPECIAAVRAMVGDEKAEALFKQALLVRPEKDHKFPDQWRTNMTDSNRTQHPGVGLAPRNDWKDRVSVPRDRHTNAQQDITEWEFHNWLKDAARIYNASTDEILKRIESYDGLDADIVEFARETHSDLKDVQEVAEAYLRSREDNNQDPTPETDIQPS